jgi:hypothetical protein
MWSTHQTAGFDQVAFPSGHDTTRGYRSGAATGVNPVQLPLGFSMQVDPQELLSVTIAGSVTAGDVEQNSMLLHYEDLPGVNARLIKADEADRRAEKLTTIEASIVSSAGPGYSGTALINAGSDLLMANRDYALMGFYSRTAVHLIGLVGPDTGNMRVAAPGVLRPELSSQWFAALSRATGMPCVPVINSGNKASTNFFVATDENAGTFVITAFLALLK